MKKHQLWSILLLLAGTFFATHNVNAQVTAVRLTVELPGNGIQKDSSVFVTGTFNHWNPRDSDYCMKRIDSKHYMIEIPCFKGKKYDYKYTLGNWNGVEKATDNKDINNRTLIATKKLKVKDVIASWNKPATKTSKDTANMLSKEQMTKLTILKDSVGKSLPAILPRLLELLQKININLLEDQPNDALSKQYNKEAGEVISQVLDSLTNAFKQMASILTPEQKQKIREAMKDPNAPKDLMNLIGKLAPDSK